LIFNILANKITTQKEIKHCENPLLIAHRGGPDYNTYEFAKEKPLEYEIWESTKSAYIRAFNKGAKAIEMDIQLTKDNEIIILHDDTLDRTTNSTGNASELTLLEFDRVFTNKNYNETLPTLKWVFEKFKNNITYIIEVKKPKTADKNKIIIEKLINLIKEYHLENNCQVISFYPSPLTLLKKFAPEISTGLLIYTKNIISIMFLNFAFTYGVDTISFNYDGLTEDLVNQCRMAGFKVATWTVNSREDFEFMKKLKIDYITSDFFYLNQP